jgi:hypothetical protein
MSIHMRFATWLGLLVLFIYILSFAGIPHSIDELATTTVADSMLHGTLQVNRMEWEQKRYPPQNAYGLDDNLYSKKGLGVPLITLPFLLIGKQWPGIGAVQLTFLSIAFVTALTVFLFYHLAIALGYGRAIAGIAALTLGVGTLLWPYSKWLFSEPVAAFGLCLALFGLVRFFGNSDYRWLLAVSFGLAIIALARSSNAVIVLPFLVAIAYKLIADYKQRHDRRAIVKGIVYFGLLLGLTGLGLIVYNYVRFGTYLSYPLVPGEGFTAPLTVGVPGLLWSSGRGLLFFVPLTWLIGLSYFANGRRMLSPEYLVALAVVLIPIFFYGRWYDWPGGQAWGPRFLVPVMPAITMLCLPAIAWLGEPDAPRWRRYFLVAWLGLTILAQVPGVIKNFQYQEIIDGGLGQTFEELLWSWPHSPLLTYWTTLLNGAEDPIWLHPFFWSNRPWLLIFLGGLALAILVLHLRQGFHVIRRPNRQLSRSQLLWLGALTAALGIGMVYAARSDPRWLEETETFTSNQAVRAWIDDHVFPEDMVLLDLEREKDTSGRIWEWINYSSSKADYIGWRRKPELTIEDKDRLEAWLAPYGRVLLSIQETPFAAPESTTENWLRQWAYEGDNQWLGAQRITEFYLPHQEGQVLASGTATWYEQQPLQVMYTVRYGRVPGSLLIDLHWTHSTERDVKFSIQARDEQGNISEQVDRPPATGENSHDRVGMMLPSQGANLILKIYDPVTWDAALLILEDGQTAEYVILANIP